MSWSQSLIKETISDASSPIIKVEQGDNTFKAKFELYLDNLKDNDYSPFYLIGKNLTFKVGSNIKLNNYEATIVNYQYDDGQYQVVDITIKPIFNVDDLIKDTITKAKYKITDIKEHYYEAINADNEKAIIPLCHQHLAKKV